MLNRILVQFTNEEEVQFLAGFVNELKHRYKGVDITGLYVRNTEEYMRYNSAVYSDTFYQDFMDVWKSVEEKKENAVREQFEQFFKGCEFLCGSGHSDEIVLDELRLYDLLVIGKQEFINHEMKSLLRGHHKPVIIVPKGGGYSLERIMLADDEGLEANKALFTFMSLFEDIKHFHAVAVNIDLDSLRTLDVYMRKVGKDIIYNCKTGHAEEVLLKASEEFDLMIMGDLKHSFFVERLGGKVGLKILENMRIPVFIA
jgi:nucleotide-binding universal stress UspA family protein